MHRTLVTGCIFLGLLIGVLLGQELWHPLFPLATPEFQERAISVKGSVVSFDTATQTFLLHTQDLDRPSRTIQISISTSTVIALPNNAHGRTLPAGSSVRVVLRNAGGPLIASSILVVSS